MTILDVDFKNIPFHMDQRNPCSPIPPDFSWRGLLINAPEIVTYKEDDTIPQGYLSVIIPICGFLSLDDTAISEDDHMVISATDKATGKIYSAGVGEKDPSHMEADPDEEPVDPALLEGMSIEEYFNENLTEYFQLPMTPATYDVYVEFGPFKSNTVTVNVRKKL